MASVAKKIETLQDFLEVMAEYDDIKQPVPTYIDERVTKLWQEVMEQAPEAFKKIFEEDKEIEI